MIKINNLYKSDICLYHPYEDQFFGYFIQYNKLMKNINKKLLCIKNNKNTLFLKDIYTIDFGDTSNLVGYTHNNRYKPEIKTTYSIINNLTFINKDYVNSFLSYDFKNVTMLGHIYLDWVFIYENNNKFYFNGKVLYSTIGVPEKHIIKNFPLLSIKKVNYVDVYEIIADNKIGFYCQKLYKTRKCHTLIENIKNDPPQTPPKPPSPPSQVDNNSFNQAFFTSASHYQSNNSDSDDTIYINNSLEIDFLD